MKKLAMITAALAMAIGLSACGRITFTITVNDKTYTNETAEDIAEETLPELTDEDAGITVTETNEAVYETSVDKNDLEIMKEQFAIENGEEYDTLTIPAAFFTNQSEEKIKNDAVANGFESCTINEDGSVTYVLTKERHAAYLKKLEDAILEANNSMLSTNGEYGSSSFVRIEHDESYSQFDVYVDNSAYTILDNLYMTAFYAEGGFYQIFAGVDPETMDVTVRYIDNETGKVIKVGTYQGAKSKIGDIFDAISKKIEQNGGKVTTY